jgi:Skp family chaperone for outer membrane proteins
MKIALLLLAVVLPIARARAIELSLEENRTQRGSVGYVDMQRVFAESPDAATAKESFESIVREAEERVNLKRAELLKLRQELADIKAQREKLAKETLAAPPPTVSTAPVSGPAIYTSPAAAAVGAAPARTASLPTSAVSSASPAALQPPPVTALPPASLPGMPTSSGALTAPTAAAPAVAFSSSTRALGSAPMLLPGLSAPVLPVVPVAPVTASTAAAVAAHAPAVAAPVIPVVSTAAAPPATAAVAAPRPATVAAASNPASLILDLDVKIIALQADILRKEEALARERNETDRGLVSIEGRKTDQVLVRIYAAITAVARQESISIVVDRSTILYGHQGVDLTDKVLQYLRSAPQ